MMNGSNVDESKGEDSEYGIVGSRAWQTEYKFGLIVILKIILAGRG